MRKSATETTEEEIAKRLRIMTPWLTIKTDLHCGFDRISRVAKFMKCNKGSAPSPLPNGRRPIIIPTILTFIEEETLINPSSGSHRLAHQILANFGIPVSQTTVSSLRHLLKFRFQKPRTTQNLTETQIQKRIEFCTHNLTNEIDWSSNVIISDESRFSMVDDSRRRWIRRGVYLSNTFQKKSKFSKSLMVWACIGKNFKSPLIFIEGNLNTDGYIQMLRNNNVFDTISESLNSETVYFQQDGATCHTSKRSIEYIKEHIQLIENWPSNSPDLSPIENLWAILKLRLQEKAFATLDELKILMIQEWDSLEISLINSLIDKIPERMELCLKQSGKQIGHLLHKIKAQTTNENDDEITIANGTEFEEVKSILDIFKTTSNETFFEKTCLKTICYFKKFASVFQYQNMKFEYFGECVVAIVETENKNCILIRHLSRESTSEQSIIDAQTNPKCHATVAISLILKNCEGWNQIWLIRFKNSKTRDAFYAKVIECTNINAGSDNQTSKGPPYWDKAQETL
jgi:hypothetical protein